jgi:hypothetical protein
MVELGPILTKFYWDMLDESAVKITGKTCLNLMERTQRREITVADWHSLCIT